MAIIKFDFDETIAHNSYPDITKATLCKNAAATIKFAKSLGHTLILDTCRHDKDLEDAKQFLKENKLEFDYINENAVELIERYGDCRKIACDLSIDDKNSGGIDWTDIHVDIGVFFTKENEENEHVFDFLNEQYRIHILNQ